jgi:hypothetical protein
MPGPTTVYAYKLTCDNGGAPCVHRGRLSLAICKPEIRRRAQLGDLIVGIGGRDLGGRLIYLAVVTGKLEGGGYYDSPEYAGRPDRIYRRGADGTAELVPKPRFHNDLKSPQLAHDVGADFQRAYVLLSDDFRYFGGKGTTEFRITHPAVGALADSMRRGHRVNFSPEVSTQLLALKEHLWARFPQKKSGQPTQADCALLCNRGSVCATEVRPTPNLGTP